SPGPLPLRRRVRRRCSGLICWLGGATTPDLVTMLYRFTPPPSTDSPLGRLDPRWRLAGLLALVVAIAVVRSLPGGPLAAAGSMLLVVLARVSWSWYREGLLVVGSLVALFVLPLPLLARVDAVEGLRLGGVLLTKALALYNLTAALLSTPLEATLKAAR